MPKVLTLRLSSLFVWLSPFVLLALKFAQLKVEHRLAGSADVVSVVELLARRLDDPSFWAIFASGLAALLILHGTVKVGGDKVSWDARDVKRFGRWGIIVACTIGITYLVITVLKKEALFFLLGSGPEQRDPEMILIQAAEGVVNLMSIWIMARFFSVALVGIEQLRRLKNSKDKGLKAAATCYVCAGTLPISAFLFAPLSFQILTWAFGSQPDFTKPWPLSVGLLSILPMAIPFGIVAIRGLIAFHGIYKPSFNTLALLHVVVWLGMIPMGLADSKPPKVLVSTDSVVGILLCIIGMFLLATPVTFWVSYD